MTDDPTQSESTQEQPALAGQPTNIEALQELKAHEGNQAATEQAVRQLLSVLDPHPQDHALTYQQVLERLGTVITRESQKQGETPA